MTIFDCSFFDGKDLDDIFEDAVNRFLDWTGDKPDWIISRAISF